MAEKLLENCLNDNTVSAMYWIPRILPVGTRRYDSPICRVDYRYGKSYILLVLHPEDKAQLCSEKRTRILNIHCDNSAHRQPSRLLS